jgi:putative hydrolase
MDRPRPGPAESATEPLPPAEALDRIVYLLDRALAESQKVRAFARARDTVRELGDDEVRRRHDAGTLTELAGIGPTTAGIIAETLAGEVPGYLSHLEEDTVIPPGEGAELRAALRGDCHTHSTWSDGGAAVEVMARTAVALGHEYMVLTDHSPRLTVAHGLTADRLRAQLDEVRALNERLAPFRILTGIEVDILPDGSLDQSEELLAQLDLVVASVHSKLRMERTEMTRRMVTAVASPHVDVLGHCTGRKLPAALRFANRAASGRRSAERLPDGLSGRSGAGGRPPANFDPEIVFAACAQFDTALEINCRPERQDPPEDLLELAIEWGLRFSIDTDAHAPGQLEWQAYGCDKATRAGLAADDVVNTLSADDLLAWTATHAP